MSSINYTYWLNNLYESYNNKIIPNLIDRTDNNTNLELEYTEPILYRSTLDIDFDSLWLEKFPPLIKRQNAFIYI